jgi:hypothetical protein
MLARGFVGLVLLLGGLARADEAPAADPHAEMAAALEAQADTSPAPPTLPEHATAPSLPRAGPARKAEADAARAAAVRAAIRAETRAAALEVGRTAAKAAPPAQAERQHPSPGQPRVNKHH